MNARTQTPLGLVYDLPNEEYHAGPGLSNSGLTLLAKSPAHYYGMHLDPARPPAEEKAGQLHGTLCHCATLEPAYFDLRYAVGPTCNRNTKKWHDFVDKHLDAVCIQADQRETAFAQAAAVRALPDVNRLLSAGRPEVSAFWFDEETGVLCRCRPDWVHPMEGCGVILVDLKTYSDASPREFARQVARKKYHVQAAFYSDGYEAASGVLVVGFVFVAVETEWPHAASAVMLDDESLAKGRSEARELTNLYAECVSTGRWPGYGQQIESITLPAWAL